MKTSFSCLCILSIKGSCNFLSTPCLPDKKEIMSVCIFQNSFCCFVPILGGSLGHGVHRMYTSSKVFRRGRVGNVNSCGPDSVQDRAVKVGKLEHYWRIKAPMLACAPYNRLSNVLHTKVGIICSYFQVSFKPYDDATV